MIAVDKRTAAYNSATQHSKRGLCGRKATQLATEQKLVPVKNMRFRKRSARGICNAKLLNASSASTSKTAPAPLSFNEINSLSYSTSHISCFLKVLLKPLNGKRFRDKLPLGSLISESRLDLKLVKIKYVSKWALWRSLL